MLKIYLLFSDLNMEMNKSQNEVTQKQELPLLYEQEKGEQQLFHVLAVDDNDTERKVLERLLKVSSKNYQVTSVKSGDKALEYLGLVENSENNVSFHDSSSSSPSSPSLISQPTQQEGMKVNLIMTDFCMPGMTGYDLLKRLKGSYWKDVPVVVMSSDNIPSRISMCLEGGAEEFLLKPLQLSDMKKLQPHLQKSLHHSCKPIDDQDESSSGSNIDINNNINNVMISKRKAISPEPPERRPKIKGVAVV